ncbi:MAG: hypothetical protein IKP33_09360 [Prevotella sp.]|nr:hypothetical protein [Prevotella sp.]MBR6885410.1 hypothetical protein [Prevotella sp.]
MKKDYIKPFVKVKVLDTDLCLPVNSGAEAVDPANADAKEFFDFFE